MSEWRTEWKPLALIAALFAACFWLPVGVPRFDNAVTEALHLTRWYAREHVLLCLVPAFVIAGGISVFVSQASVMKYLGARANKFVAYGVASVSGTILAVCSCTVLPLFSGIYRMGAGLGPACAFLYSGPAISVLAIVLSARILGIELGTARGASAVIFSLVIGLLMAVIFRKDEEEKVAAQSALPEPEVRRPLWQNACFFATLVGILVFANWGKPDGDGVWHVIWAAKWWITGACAAALGVILVAWFGMPCWKVVAAGAPVVLLLAVWPALSGGWAETLSEFKVLIVFSAGFIGLAVITGTQPGEPQDWLEASWTLAKQILPLLLGGVLISGLLLGRPGKEGLIPNDWVAHAVGGNSLLANFVASFLGAFMYFATLTEVPIVQGLTGSGMGNGPALSLLLAGPALSLPSMLVIHGVMGTKKTFAFVVLVVVLSTFTGWMYGAVWG